MAKTPSTAATPAADDARLRAQAAEIPDTADVASAAGAAAFADGHVDAPPASAAIRVSSSDEDGLPPLSADDARLRTMMADLATPRVEVIQAKSERYILIVCGEPGFRRAGLMHPSRAEYPPDFFAAEQLAMIRAEPKLQLVAIGGEPVPREGPPHGDFAQARPLDPLLAGRAAADAISRPPNRAEPGLRNAGSGTRLA